MPFVKIAGLSLEIKYADATFFEKRLSQYIVSPTPNPDFVLKTKYADSIAQPSGKVLKEIGQVKLIQIGDVRFCRCLYDEAGELLALNEYNMDYSDVVITLSPKLTQSGYSLADFEYYHTGFAFSDRMLTAGGAVLHGSAIALDGQGIVFSANSGTGKSTQSGLWKEYFGERIDIINDDKPAIRFSDNGYPWLYGTPWSGKTALNENRSVPLKAIIFIDRAETNHIEALRTRDSIFRLMSQISRPYYDEDLGVQTMRVINNIVQTVPIYILHCNISVEAVESVYKKLTEEGVIES